MTNNLVERSFTIAKEKYLGNISLTEARDKLEAVGVNPNSAADYIYLYSHLRDGSLFKRRANEYAINYYLENIQHQNGNVALGKALQSLLKHIEFWESYSGTRVIGQRNIYDKYSEELDNDSLELIYPGEKHTTEGFLEGKTKTIVVNAYERNNKARKKCISHYGPICQVCELNFEDKYGEIGKGFIHVHHIKEISTIQKEYEVDPIKDLIPVCPNCHAMLHKNNPAFTVKELKFRLK